MRASIACKAFRPAGHKIDEDVAELFQVGEATVHRWKRLERESGPPVLRPPVGGGMPPRVAPEQYDLVREFVKEEPDLTVQEVAWEFHRRTDRSVSRASMGRTLRKLALTRNMELERDRTENASNPGVAAQVPRAHEEARPSTPRLRGRGRQRHRDDSRPRQGAAR